MSQPALFYEDYHAALRDDVAALGGAKTVGKWFCPEKEIEAARNWLNDRLNGQRRERLSDEQERLIMRRAKEARGFSAGMCFICDDTGHERAKPINPEDEKAALQREVIEAARKVTLAVDKLERMAQSPLARVA